jgi:hypothetical protein
MSTYLPWPILVIYCVYSVFAVQQKRCYLKFQGASPIYCFLLGVLAFFNLFFGVGFLIYYAFRTTWWAPLILVALGLFVYAPMSSFRFMSDRFAVTVWGLLSFVTVPICALLLIHFTPDHAGSRFGSERSNVEARSDLHYINSKHDCDEALRVVIRFGGVTELPSKEASDVAELLQASVTEAELVKDSYLQQVHPEFVRRYKDDYIASLRSLAEAVRTGNLVKQISASATYNRFSDWMSSHANELKFP